MTSRVRDPHPRLVTHRALGAYHGRAYWVRIDEVDGDSAQVRAEVTAPNQVALTSEGVRAMTVYVDPALHRADRPVTVTWNGRVVHRGEVTPSLDAVATSYAESRDPALTFARAVHLREGLRLRPRPRLRRRPRAPASGGSSSADAPPTAASTPGSSRNVGARDPPGTRAPRSGVDPATR